MKWPAWQRVCGKELAGLLGNGRAPEAVGPGLGKFCEVGGLQAIDVEPTVGNERGDVTGYVAALEQPLSKGFGRSLPTLNAEIGGKSVFEEDEFAAGLEHTANASNGLDYAGNGT